MMVEQEFRVRTVYATASYDGRRLDLPVGVPLFFRGDWNCLVPPTAFCVHIAKSHSRSIASAKTYGSALKRWLSYCDDEGADADDPSFDDVLGWRDDLIETVGAKGEQFNPRTINSYVAMVLSYYRWTRSRQLVSGDPFVVRSLEGNETQHRRPSRDWRLKSRTMVRPRSVPKSAIDAILPHLPEPYRTCAIVAGATGMRAGEVACELHVASIPAVVNAATPAFVDVVIRGKGGVIGRVKLPKKVAAVLKRYADFTRFEIVQARRRIDPTYKEPRQLLLTDAGDAFTGRAVSKAWKSAKDSAGYADSPYFFHSLRHTYAYAMLAHLAATNEALYVAGRPSRNVLTTLAALMRHAHIETTMIYLDAVSVDAALIASSIADLFDRHLK